MKDSHFLKAAGYTELSLSDSKTLRLLAESGQGSGGEARLHLALLANLSAGSSKLFQGFSWGGAGNGLPQQGAERHERTRKAFLIGETGATTDDTDDTDEGRTGVVE